MRPCPHCGGQLKDAATLCKWCQRAVGPPGDPLATPAGLYCPNCGFRGLPIQKQKGSPIVGVALLFFFIVPGLIYFIWLSSSAYMACPQCGNAHMIPADAPKALEAQSGGARQW